MTLLCAVAQRGFRALERLVTIFGRLIRIDTTPINFKYRRQSSSFLFILLYEVSVVQNKDCARATTSLRSGCEIF